MNPTPYDILLSRVASVDDKLSSGTIGDHTPPIDEPLEILNEHGLEFLSADYSTEASAKPCIKTGLFGLLGAIGPMPYHYSETVSRSERANEFAVREFFRIISHRATSLLYRAWRKSRLTYEYLPGASDEVQDRFTKAIAALSGSTGMADRMAWLDLSNRKPENAPDLFVRSVRNAAGLTQFLRRQFAMPFQVEELVGSWEPIPDSTLPTLGQGGIKPSLGRNTILGKRVWQVQSTFRLLILRPTPEQYEALKPASESLRRIQLATRMYCTAELAFRIRILVSGKSFRSGALGSTTQPAILGWNTTAGPPDPNRYYSMTISKDYNEERMKL